MNTGKHTSDNEQPSVTSDGEETDDGGNCNCDTGTSGLIETARNLSEIIAPFAGLATVLVQGITAFKVFREVA